MAEAKYLWELPVLSEIVDDNVFLAAENANPIAYQTNASSVKQYCNTEIVCEDPTAIFSDIVQAKLIADGSDGYIVEFTGDVALIATLIQGTKIQKDDGTIFCISDKFNSNPNLAVVIVETLGTDPLVYSDIYYTYSSLLVNSNNYISTPKVLSNEIYTKTHIIDSINETAAQKHNIGREESVSTVTGDYLQTSNSKYRSLNSVGFKSCSKNRTTQFYSLNPTVGNPNIFYINNFINYINIGNDITKTSSSFIFLTEGVYRINVNLDITTLATNVSFLMFMLDNNILDDDINKFVSNICVVKLDSVSYTFISTSFDIVITNDKIGNEYTFYYYTNNTVYISADHFFWTGHQFGYASQIDVLKIQ